MERLYFFFLKIMFNIHIPDKITFNVKEV